MPKFNPDMFNQGVKKSRSATVADLGSGLLNSETKARNDGQLNITYIDISKLHVADINTYSTDNILELEESILDVGLMQNLDVMPDCEDEYAILSGQRRYLALKSLIEKGQFPADYKVPCFIVDLDKLDKDEIRDLDPETKATYITAITNVTRVRTAEDNLLLVAQLEKVYAAIRANGGQERLGSKAEFIAKITGTSARTAQSVLTINAKASPAVRDAVANENLSVGVGAALATLPNEEQQELIEAAHVADLEPGEDAKLTVKDVEEFKTAKTTKTKRKVTDRLRKQTSPITSEDLQFINPPKPLKDLVAVASSGMTINAKAKDDIEGIKKQFEKLYAKLSTILEKEIKLPEEGVAGTGENIGDDQDDDFEPVTEDNITF